MKSWEAVLQRNISDLEHLKSTLFVQTCVWRCPQYWESQREPTQRVNRVCLYMSAASMQTQMPRFRESQEQDDWEGHLLQLPSTALTETRLVVARTWDPRHTSQILVLV